MRSIEQEHRGQVDRCFTECLGRWLRKADGVENPTIDTLITALRRIGENAVADGITGYTQSEMCCFKLIAVYIILFMFSLLFAKKRRRQANSHTYIGSQ